MKIMVEKPGESLECCQSTKVFSMFITLPNFINFIIMSFDKANEMKNSMIKVMYIECREVSCKISLPNKSSTDLLIKHLFLGIGVVPQFFFHFNKCTNSNKAFVVSFHSFSWVLVF